MLPTYLKTCSNWQLFYVNWPRYIQGNSLYHVTDSVCIMWTTVNWVHKNIFLNNWLDFFQLSFFFQINITKIYIHTYISFSGSIVYSLKQFEQTLFPMIYFIRLYTLLWYIWQNMGMYSSTVIKELSFYLLWVLKSLALDKSKWIFCR